MGYNIAFYIHHHGSGHLMRSLAIAAHLENCSVTFLGSDLERYRSIIPDKIRCIILPPDTKTENDNWFMEREVSGLHYAPLNVAGQTARVAMLSAFFAAQAALLLVVDVSVEVAMLATLCGVPTVVVRQHGKRDDLPHTIAYRNAAGLLAPYDRNLQPDEDEWLSEKTFFTGGFSRYNPQSHKTEENCREVAILVGRGGTSINEPFISRLVDQCSDWHFHLIGNIDGMNMGFKARNLSVYDHLENPLPVLNQCVVVIGNAGHNTVMELASLNKRMILIPESRPFDEQLVKAQMLEKLNLARVILPESMLITDWSEELNKILLVNPNWVHTIKETAANDAAAYLRALFLKQFF
jgi:UDP:flavonoid glycosyltransferase YjiC (YdhE family)